MNNLSNILYNNRNKLLFDVMRVEMNSPTKLVVDSGQHIDEPIALIANQWLLKWIPASLL